GPGTTATTQPETPPNPETGPSARGSRHSTRSLPRRIQMTRMPTPMGAALVPRACRRFYRALTHRCQARPCSVKQAFVHSATGLSLHTGTRQHRADNGEGPRWAVSSAYCPGLDGETEIFAVRDDTHRHVALGIGLDRTPADGKRLRLDVGFEPAGMAEDDFARGEFLCRPCQREDGIVRGEHQRDNARAVFL